MMVEIKIVDDLLIRSNDRISIFGRTGSGKTFFVKNWLLPQYSNYVFYDFKHENDDVDHEIVINTPNQLKIDLDTYQKILYQPTQTNIRKEFNSVCDIIFKHKNTSLYVDESSNISTPSSILPYHNIIMTQGRTYNVGVINAAQRPRIIHNTIISESEHLFVFSLNLETDVDKIKEQIGAAAEDIHFLPEHHFLYHNVRFNRSYIFKPIPRHIHDPTKIDKFHELEIYHPTLEEYIKIIERHRARERLKRYIDGE